MSVMYPDQFRYTKEHEWIQIEGDTASIGITHHAQEQLGDVVYVELPKTGTRIQASQSFGTVESVKAVSDIFAPVTGEIIAVNEALVDAPETLNEDPHARGWLVRIKIEDRSELASLMTAEQYQQFLSSESES
jgi:glycine cleavage system H protein